MLKDVGNAAKSARGYLNQAQQMRQSASNSAQNMLQDARNAKSNLIQAVKPPEMMQQEPAINFA